MNAFVIETQLPSLNQYQYACRSHWSKGRDFKSSVEATIGDYVCAALLRKELHKVERPCEIYIEWHERTKKRDCDNIQSAQKFILDSLQHYGVIKNDSRKYVKQIYHKIYDDDKDFVVVRIEEKGELKCTEQ